MKKIFLLFFGLIFVSLNSFADSLDDIDIVLAIKKIDEINAQIEAIKAQAVDKNETAEQNVLFKGVVTKKSELLEKIPYLLMETRVDDEKIAQFRSDKSKLETKVKRLKAANNKKAYIESAMELEKMNMEASFYKTLIELGKIFSDGARTAKIKSGIEDGLLDLQTNSYVSIKELKSSMDGMGIQGYINEFNSLELYRKTFEEILIYLRDNAELFSTNYFFSELNLKTAIGFINQQIPFEMKDVNFGKIILILFVFLFFISFTRILSAITYKILLSLFAKDHQGKFIKDQVMGIVKRPIFFILAVYAIDLCASIFYYPAPVPIKFVNYFSIVFIISFTWLILSILDSYGMVFISEITKKSGGRKEVINLIIKIVYFIIIVIAFLLILSRLGFNVSAIIASLGIGGLAIALATKDILANFFASIMMLFDNSFSQGDNIVCGDIEGVVVEIGLRKTTVRTADNALIFVPNSKLASDPIRNWTRRRLGRLIKLTVALEYRATGEQVKKCAEEIKEMLLNHPDIAKPNDLGSNDIQNTLRLRKNIVSIDDLIGYKSNLFVAVDNLSDSSIDILVYCFSKTIVWGEFLSVKEDVILKIMNIVEKNGLSFAFPSQSLYIENLKDAMDTKSIIDNTVTIKESK
ncbi:MULTISPECIES: mechanosensitive ion channel family protein [unclassified Campylobacter]|uniref:mechanosensitive ion channel family protein n=1 Tax=unclassified Campylobacter TaxID=2593542 RepID=UPI0014744A8C|nr:MULTISPECIES: mechanosensitive ion channel family protein [unclassified Campylobacter]